MYNLLGNIFYFRIIYIVFEWKFAKTTIVPVYMLKLTIIDNIATHALREFETVT